MIGYTTVGLGVVGLGVGTYYGLSAASAKEEYGDTSQEANDAAEASTTTFIVGGALTTVGFLLLIFDGDSETDDESTDVAVAPLLSTEAVGAAFSGRF